MTRTLLLAVALVGGLGLACGFFGGGEVAPVPEATSVQAKLTQILPLSTGSRWQYRLVEDTKGAPRVLFSPVGQSGRTNIGTWSVELTGLDGQGRHQARVTRAVEGEDSQETELSLWVRQDALWMSDAEGERLALEAVLPSRVISTETVSCLAHFLGGVAGECGVRAGGALNANLGLVEGLVSSEKGNDLKGIARWVVGISTLGTLIPGNRRSSRSVVLVQYSPGAPVEGAPVSPLWQDWRGWIVADAADATIDDHAAAFDRMLRRRGADGESVGAIARSVEDSILAQRLSLDALPLLPPEDRLPVVRVVLPMMDAGFERTRYLAQALVTLQTIDPLERPAVDSRFDTAEEVAQVERLLSGNCPALVLAYQRTATAQESWVDASRAALAVHPLNEATAVGLLSATPFNHEELLGLMLAQAPTEEHGQYVLITLRQMHFETPMLELVSAHRDALLGLPAQDRQEVVAMFEGDEVQGRVAALLGL